MCFVPLLLLHDLQSGWALSIAFLPPLKIGKTWSSASFISGSLRPHLRQVNLYLDFKFIHSSAVIFPPFPLTLDRRLRWFAEDLSWLFWFHIFIFSVRGCLATDLRCCSLALSGYLLRHKRRCSRFLSGFLICHCFTCSTLHFLHQEPLPLCVLLSWTNSDKSFHVPHLVHLFIFPQNKMPLASRASAIRKANEF